MTDSDLPSEEEIEALAEDGDAETALLLGILSELTTIRRALTTQSDAGSDDDATWTCRGCGASFDAEDTACDHARRAHNAPEGDEHTLLQ